MKQKEKKLVNQTELAKLAGVAQQVIARQIKAGKIPIAGRSKAGKPLFDPEVALQKRKENLGSNRKENYNAKPHPLSASHASQDSPKPPSKPTLMDAQTRNMAITSELKSLELRKKQGELIEVKLIKERWFGLALTMRQHYESLPDRLSANLSSRARFKVGAGKDEKVVNINQKEMYDALNEEIKKVLENLADALRV